MSKLNARLEDSSVGKARFHALPCISHPFFPMGKNILLSTMMVTPEMLSIFDSIHNHGERDSKHNFIFIAVRRLAKCVLLQDFNMPTF